MDTRDKEVSDKSHTCGSVKVEQRKSKGEKKKEKGACGIKSE